LFYFHAPVYSKVATGKFCFTLEKTKFTYCKESLSSEHTKKKKRREKFIKSSFLSIPQTLFSSVKLCGWATCFVYAQKKRLSPQTTVNHWNTKKRLPNRRTRKEIKKTFSAENGFVQNVLFWTNSYSRKNFKFIENICERYVKIFFYFPSSFIPIFIFISYYDCNNTLRTKSFFSFAFAYKCMQILESASGWFECVWLNLIIIFLILKYLKF
jgi:hypothetical protein